MPKHNSENEQLYVFANALRNFLDLDPIYQDGRSSKRDNWFMEGIYIPEYWWATNFDGIKYNKTNKTPNRGSHE